MQTLVHDKKYNLKYMFDTKMYIGKVVIIYA